jgi:neutral ceramidase
MMNRLLSLAVLFLIAPVAGAQANPQPWRAGVAKVAITPPVGVWMSGYGSRTKPAEGKVHDLWAKALVLQDSAGKRGVLVTMDLVGIDRDLSFAVCKTIEAKHHIPRASIMLAVSHTHCGPVVGNNLRAMYDYDDEQRKRVDTYAKDLQANLVRVVDLALAEMFTAEVSHGVGQATFAVNRRNNKEADVPKLREEGRLVGPVDHDVPVLCVRDDDGKIRAIVFGYACHATVLSFQQWCGDYPGFAQIELEKMHPGAVALFAAGCGADQNPLPRRTVALAEQYGKELATSVRSVLNAPMRKLDQRLTTTYAEIDLTYGELPSREMLVKDSLGKDRFVAGRARLLLDEIEKRGSLRKTYPYPVQTWQVGDLSWVALGGEVCVDYALRLKRTHGPLWVTGYANDVMAYIPSLRVLKEGGYEGATSMIYYGLPASWGPRIEELIVDAVRAQLSAKR